MYQHIPAAWLPLEWWTVHGSNVLRLQVNFAYWRLTTSLMLVVWNNELTYAVVHRYAMQLSWNVRKHIINGWSFDSVSLYFYASYNQTTRVARWGAYARISSKYIYAQFMARGINIYSSSLISRIRIPDISNWITDINNSNSWYQEFICWYQEFEFLISTIDLRWYQQWFADIRHSNTSIKNTSLISGILLLISTIGILDIKNSNSWYQELVLLISRITITATLHYWYR